MRKARERARGLEDIMEQARSVAGRLLRYVFYRWLKKAEKIHFL
jgi:hypothetical protein